MFRATWDPVDFTLARSVYSAVSRICCCPNVDAVDELLNQLSEGVLSPFASWHGCGGYLLGFCEYNCWTRIFAKCSAIYSKLLMWTLSLSIRVLSSFVKGRIQNTFSDLMKKATHCSLASPYKVQVGTLGTIWRMGHSHGLLLNR